MSNSSDEGSESSSVDVYAESRKALLRTLDTIRSPGEIGAFDIYTEYANPGLDGCQHFGTQYMGAGCLEVQSREQEVVRGRLLKNTARYGQRTRYIRTTSRSSQASPRRTRNVLPNPS
ncbi:hypothetical protein LB505_010857 [Fusarium chuoi]|nr:hypothetical protein LB505_010857 [Fusarium chuoi]